MRRALAATAVVLLLPGLAGCQKLQARVVLKEGNSYYTQEQYSKALAKYQEGLKLDPTATFAWRSVGLTALALFRPGSDDPKNVGYGKTAAEAFEKYLADNPDDSKIQDYLLSTYVNDKQYDKALNYAADQTRLHPDQKPKFDKVKLNVLMQAGRLEQAAQMAQQTPGPDQAQLLDSLGVTAWGKVYNNQMLSADDKTKLIEMGLTSLQKAIELKPDFADAMVYLGLLYREKAKLEIDGAKRLEDTALAEQWQKRALDLRKKASPAAKAK